MKVFISIENNRFLEAIVLVTDEVGNFASVEFRGNLFNGTEKISLRLIDSIPVLTEFNKISYILKNLEIMRINQNYMNDNLYDSLVKIFNSLSLIDIDAFIRNHNSQTYTLEKLSTYFENMNKEYITYIFDNKLKSEFFLLLEKHLDLDKFGIANLSDDSARTCAKWLSELLALKGFERPHWLVEREGCYVSIWEVKEESIGDFIKSNDLENYRYPHITKQGEKFLSIYGCRDGKWDETALDEESKTALKRYNFKGGFVSEISNIYIFKALKERHDIQNNLQPFLKQLNEKLKVRFTRISEVDGFSTKEKIKNIHENDWLMFSVASKKKPDGETTKPYLDLIEMTNKR